MTLFAALAFVSPTLWVLVLTVATCGLLLRSWRFVEGTTLVGPWLWTQASLCVIGGTQVAIALAHGGALGGSGNDSANWEAAVLFAAASSSFCPLISLLGAKRPQDRGWHFVVLSLWAILVLPVAESLVLRHGQMPDVQGARSWFMLILIGLGVINTFPTRYSFPGLLFGGGQLLMLADSLPIVRELFDASPMVAGFSGCAISVMMAARLAGRRTQAKGSLDVVWRDFRDSFGLLWGLRIQEQINITARSSKWPLRLRWHGFVDERGEPLDFGALPEETRRPLHQATENLLRRFVSSDWIAARMGKAID
ncbi:MAG: hypothetical protein WD070_06610 [Pirellulaceae bacterium]